MTKKARRRKKANSKGRAPHATEALSEHDAETIRLCQEALDNPTGLAALRQIACERGLVNKHMRSRCWPLLLGLQPETSVNFTEEQYEQWHSAKHRDSSVVEVDVDRSLWAFMRGSSDEQRQAVRAQLRRLLDATIGKHAGPDPGQQVHYYQGLHDVASVLLLELGGEAQALPLLSQLAVGHLRDCTRASLDPVLEVLQLLWPLLSYADPGLGRALQQHDLPPFFALSWFITWFAHDATTLEAASRLFDVFLACHPLMPLYLGVAAMSAVRTDLLACSEPCGLHSLLAHLEPGAQGMPPLEQLVQRALGLMGELPPGALLLCLGRDAPPLQLCVSPWAQLEGDLWVVPPEAHKRPQQHGGVGPGRRRAVNGLQLLLSNLPFDWLRASGRGDISRASSGDWDSRGSQLLASTAESPAGSGRADEGRRRKPKARPLVALTVGGMLSVYVVAVLMGYAAVRGGPALELRH